MGKTHYVPPLQAGQAMQNNFLSFFITSWVRVK